MARMPPDRAPPYDEAQAFARFDLPDGRHIFVRRAAVTCVYDAPVEQRIVHGPRGIRQRALPQAAHVVTASNVMPVPYTAEETMEILYGDAG